MAGQTDFADTPETRRKVTWPLEGALWLMLALVGATLAVGVINTATSGGAVWFGFGGHVTCVSAPLNGLNVDLPGNSETQFAHGGSASADSLELCAAHPNFRQRVMVTLTEAPAYGLYLAVLVLLWLLVLAVRRHGPFARRVSGRLRALGWLILAGTLATVGGQAAARAEFAATVINHSVPVATFVINGVLTSLIPLMLIVCGLFTLARIVRLGGQLHDDLSGTV
jgi:hypothetical protein